MDLGNFQEQWLELFWSMAESPTIDPEQLAAPFLSAELENYDPIANRTILYIGKATGGCWYRNEFRENPTCAERRGTTRRFLQEVIRREYSSAFWRFAWMLNDLMPNGANKPFQNIVWSNIAKIGVTNGNPAGNYLVLQKELAEQTLKAELKFYQPSLVVFVSSSYAENLVRPVLERFGASQEASSWNKSRNDLWWRPPSDNLPALMCANHPERKNAALLREWAERASDLLNQ